MEKPENKQERMKGVYTALFVADIEKIKSQFPPKHAKVFAHHSTIEFQPFNLNDINIGEESKIKIIGRAYDEKGDALLVENTKTKNTLISHYLVLKELPLFTQTNYLKLPIQMAQ